MLLADLPGALRALAKTVEQSQAKLTEAPFAVNLDEAMKRLRAVLGKRSFQVCLDIWSHVHDSTPDIAWDIWDEKKHYRGPTLEAALAGCLAANAPPPPEPLAEAQRVLDQIAAPIPF